MPRPIATAAFGALVAALAPSSDALFANVQSSVVQSLQVSKDGEALVLEVPPFTPFLDAVTEFAVKQDLTKDIPAIFRALEAEAVGPLIVATVGIAVEKKDYSVVQYAYETPTVAARRFVNENGFVGNASLDRILRFVENKLNALSGARDGLPRWDGAAIFAATVRFRADLPAYLVEVLEGENLIDSFTGFLERTGFGDSFGQQEKSDVVTDLAVGAARQLTLEKCVELGVLTPQDAKAVGSLLRRDELFRRVEASGQSLFVRIAAAEGNVDRQLEFPFEAGATLQSALRFAELGLKESGLVNVLPNVEAARESIARELLNQAAAAVQRQSDEEAAAEEARSLAQPYLSDFDIDVAIKFTTPAAANANAGEGEPRKLEELNFVLNVKAGDDVTALAKEFCASHEEDFRSRYEASQRIVVRQQKPEASEEELAALTKALMDDYSLDICTRSVKSYAVSNVEKAKAEAAQAQAQAEADQAAAQAAAEAEAAAAVTAGDQEEETAV